MNLKLTSKGSVTELASVMQRNAPWSFADWERFIALLQNWKKPVSVSGHCTDDNMR
jgi:hypothetical protein